MILFFGSQLKKLHCWKFWITRNCKMLVAENSKETKKRPRLLSRPCLSFLKEKQTKQLQKAFALALSFDDGSSLSTREWLSLVAKADSFQEREAYAVMMFLYGFQKLEFNELNSLGLLSVVEKMLGKYLTKVFWYARDGASVMKKLVELTIEKYNPFALDVWCGEPPRQFTAQRLCFRRPWFLGSHRYAWIYLQSFSLLQQVTLTSTVVVSRRTQGIQDVKKIKKSF